MINGREVDKVHYRTMLRSIQRMQELDELKQWYVCDIKDEEKGHYVYFTFITD